MNDNQITSQLQTIEKTYGVHILTAVESGSRAWGFASPDSDWDVRFIYVHPVRWYLQVEPERDVIEVMTEDGFDAVGWDLRKALQLFRKTNPSMLEWLMSPIRYIDNDNFSESLVRLIPHYFNPTSGLHHYYSMAESHNEKYLLKNGITLKRFLYYLRSLLACKWIMHEMTPPPVPFRELVGATVHDSNLIAAINRLLDKKSKSKEHDKDSVEPILIDFAATLQEEIADYLNRVKLPAPDKDKDQILNNLLYTMAVSTC